MSRERAVGTLVEGLNVLRVVPAGRSLVVSVEGCSVAVVARFETDQEALRYAEGYKRAMENMRKQVAP